MGIVPGRPTPHLLPLCACVLHVLELRVSFRGPNGVLDCLGRVLWDPQNIFHTHSHRHPTSCYCNLSLWIPADVKAFGFLFGVPYGMLPEGDVEEGVSIWEGGTIEIPDALYVYSQGLQGTLMNT